MNMTENLPDLPHDPTLKVFVILSSLSWLAFGFSGFQSWKRRSTEERLWGLAPLLFAVATFLVARASMPWLHRTLSILVLGLAARNGVRMVGRDRWAPILGATLWVASLVLARIMFG